MSKQRCLRLFGAAVIVVGLGLRATPAHAVADNDAATCTISGSAAFSAAVTNVPASRQFSFALSWNCTALTGDEGGTGERINFIGTSPAESCASGSAVAGATGALEGQGFNSASVLMSQSGNTFTFDGTLTSTSETHHVHAVVTLAPSCPWPGNVSLAASGNGTVADA